MKWSDYKVCWTLSAAAIGLMQLTTQLDGCDAGEPMQLLIVRDLAEEEIRRQQRKREEIFC